MRCLFHTALYDTYISCKQRVNYYLWMSKSGMTLICELWAGALCCSHVFLEMEMEMGVGGACVALCLVLTHPAINCVSTAAVCIGQIESSATGPFCFSPLGWASRPPYSHWSQQSSYFFLSTALRLSHSHFLSHSIPSLFCFHFLSVSLLGEWQSSESKEKGTFLRMLFVFRPGK